jgi:hypothetical protein
MRALVFALVVLTACGGKKSDSGSSGKVASCNSEAMHACVEYRDGNLALGSDSLAKLCTAVDKDAKFSGSACPSAGVIGSCKRNEGHDFFYDGYPLASDMESGCKAQGGTFTKK